tara:strand:- start:160 stop:648 length:489 start_codon:yes stop_codon:yes gene_type:complete
MITFENGSQDIHVIWPDDYEITHWKCLQPGYYNEQEIEVPERQSIAKWGWWKLRLQKATAADLKHGCDYENCEHPITEDNKKRLAEHIQADRQGIKQKAFKRVDVFSVGQNVIREQFSAQTFNTLHIRCALLKLDKIKNELAEGVDQLEYIIRNNEGQDYDW